MSARAVIRGYATFLADVPDDQVEDGDEIVEPGGAAVAEILRAAVASRGLTTSSVYRHSFYGWAFDVCSGDETMWCMIQFADPWLLITEVRGNFLARLFRKKSEMQATVLGILGDTLAKPPFKSAEWTTRTEYETRGRRERVE